MEKTMEKIVALSKSRGFIFPGSEIYGGLANTWDYGPLGVELKNNVKKAWWHKRTHGITALWELNSKTMSRKPGGRNLSRKVPTTWVLTARS